MIKLEKDEKLDKVVSFKTAPELSDRNEGEADTNFSEYSPDSDDSFELIAYSGNDEEESKAVQEDESKIKVDLMSIVCCIVLIIVMIVLLFLVLKWFIGIELDNDVADNAVWESTTTVTSTAANDESPEQLLKIQLILEKMIRFLLPMCVFTVALNIAIKLFKHLMIKLEKDEKLDKAVSFKTAPELSDRNEGEADTNFSEYSPDSDDSFELIAYSGNDEEESKAVQEDESKIKVDLMSIVCCIVLIIVMMVLLFLVWKWFIGIELELLLRYLNA